MNETNWTDEKINLHSEANDAERIEWTRIWSMLNGGQIEEINQEKYAEMSLERCPDDVVKQLYPSFDESREFGFYKEGFSALYIVR